MKKLLTLLIVVGFATTAFGQTIVGSDHDFKGKNWNSSGEICIVCHTPHNAMGVTDAPLWNHRESTTASFSVYSTSTLNATVGQPSGVSKLCLSCHDGSVGLSDFGGVTAGANVLTGDELVGIDLSNDHPISFTYDATLATADGGLIDPSLAASSGLGSTIADDMLFGGKMECASCHDVHNSTGLSNLLLKSNAASDLCLTCHDK